MVQQVITDGTSQVPYQEFTVSIPAGGRMQFDQIFNYFRVLSQSGGALSVRLGDNGLETPFTGAGIGINFDETYRNLVLINTGGTTMTITIAIALGSVSDDRLTVSAVLSTKETQSSGFSTSQNTITTAAVQLVVANSVNGRVTVYAGALDLYIGQTNGVTSANGFLIPANSSYTFSAGCSCDVYGIRASGSSPVYTIRETY